MNKERPFDLEDRLIDFSVRIIRLAAALPKSDAGRHIAGQILRSGTSPAAHYGEAQGAESKADFVHKLRIALKEMRETRVWIKVIAKAQMVKPAALLDALLVEIDELIAILFSSVETAKKGREH